MAQHGDVELFFEVFGSDADPTLLLVNGLGSQCINYDEQWCGKFAAQGFRVVRFDNRDTGLSSKLDGQKYALRDMAGDAVAVLDAADRRTGPRHGRVDGRDDRRSDSRSTTATGCCRSRP